MKIRQALLLLGAISVYAVTTFLAWAPPAPQANQMTFFVTSAGPGSGANLGGLSGADAHCQKLAQAAGAPATRTWRAYLSANPAGQPAVNARDRIGRGPWKNMKGATIAANVDELHSDKNGMTKDTNLTEKGATVNGVRVVRSLLCLVIQRWIADSDEQRHMTGHQSRNVCEQ